MEAEKRIEAEYKDGKVIIPIRKGVEAIREKGFGTWVKKVGLMLSPFEALYLTEKEIDVIDSSTKKKIEFSDLLEKYRAENPDFWILYLIYRDLRTKGYVVKDGECPGIDFKVFERGEYGKEGPKFAVVKVIEGELTSIKKLMKSVDAARREKLELILAVVDRRNEVVYYSCRETSF